MVLAHDISKGDRTKDVQITQNITFETMLLAPDTMKGLKDSGFHKPSPIQLYGIPIGKCGFDLLLEAKSGTGKTAVFSIIALEKIDFCKGLQVVILTPTREIAAQICDVLKQIGSNYPELQVEVVMGGLPLQDDIEKFKKPVHIVVGSPGRLRHLIQDKCIDLKSVRLFVLDEADKLMESSFQSDIKFIHTALPIQKQVIMSSATYPEGSRDLINSYVQNANHVRPDSDCVLLGIDQKVSFVKYNNNIIKQTQERLKELHKILGRLQFKQCLVFCNFQVRVAEVHKFLKKEEWPSLKLHGQQEQVDRLDALKTLQQYKCRILVSTDLAARGIDASNIDLVINFELPYDWQTYLHRIGRAGRFGSYGLAITILSEGTEQQTFKDMFKSMELSINVRHLWTDKEFNVNSSAPNIPPELCNALSDNATNISNNSIKEITCNDIWKLVSSKGNKINPIEMLETEHTFKELPDSPKIELFSELMLSLEDKKGQDNDEDVVFKHIEMRKTATNTSVISHNSVIKEDTVIKDLQDNKDVNISCNSKEKIKELPVISPDSSKNVNNNINNLIEKKDKTEQYPHTSTTLLNLDLPTMFSSTKLKTHEYKKINRTICDKTYNSNVNSKDFRVNNIQSELQNKARIHTSYVNSNKNPNSYIERQTHFKLINHYDGTNNYYKKDYKYDNIHQKNNASSHFKKIMSEKRIECNKSAKLYSQWYNQLKMRMKYIEQAMYINEMSKF